MKITPENLIENIDKVGAWSMYGLAEEAIEHYFPEYKKLVNRNTSNSATVMAKLCDDWKGIVVRYHKEVGYKKFKKGYVNQF